MMLLAPVANACRSVKVFSTIGCSVLLLFPLLTTSCESKQAQRTASTAYGDARGFKVVPKSPGDDADLDSLVRFLDQLKSSSGDYIERITRIQFSTPTDACVDFLSGDHSGELNLSKKEGAWAIVHEAYHP
jgi:hypothetical protein